LAFEGLHQCFIFQAFDLVISDIFLARKNHVSQIFSIKSQKSLNHKITTRTLWLGKKLWIIQDYIVSIKKLINNIISFKYPNIIYTHGL
jgi:hypothetical protein